MATDITINDQARLPLKKRPIVLLGAGGIVRDAHLPAYRLAGFPVACIYNRTRVRAEELAAAHAIPQVASSIKEAVERAPADAVYDLALMPEQFLAALELLPVGAAVLIQKPMGNDWAQAQAILEVCRRRRLVAAINCQLRFAPFVLAARGLIERGVIGQVYDLEVRVTVRTPWELFPHVIKLPRLEIQQHSVHYIDLVRSFLGDPRGVLAKTCRTPGSTLASTRTTLALDYGDELRATITVNHDHDFGPRHQESYIKWEGTSGAIRADFGLLKNYPHGDVDRFEYATREASGAAHWETSAIRGSWFPEAFIGVMANLQCFLEGSQPTLFTSVEDVIRTMACVEAAYVSSASGATPLPPT